LEKVFFCRGIVLQPTIFKQLQMNKIYSHYYYALKINKKKKFKTCENNHKK